MIVNFKTKGKYYQFLLIQLFIGVVSILIILVKHLGLLPHHHYSYKLRPYNSFADACYEWLYIYISFSFFISILFFITKKRIINYKDLICPSCEDVKTIYIKKDKDIICEKCKVKMVPLDTFYEDKDNKEQNSE